jgi:hypothetical protein
VKKQVSLSKFFDYIYLKIITMETIEGQIIEERDINAVDVKSTEQPKKSCKSCKKGLSKGNWVMVAISMYMLFSSIYGSIKLFKEITTYFGH